MQTGSRSLHCLLTSTTVSRKEGPVAGNKIAAEFCHSYVNEGRGRSSCVRCVPWERTPYGVVRGGNVFIKYTRTRKVGIIISINRNLFCSCAERTQSGASIHCQLPVPIFYWDGNQSSTHIDDVTKLYLVTLNLCHVIVGHVTLKGQITLKGQVSKGNNRKSPWSIDFNFDVYLSWEGVYPKIALMRL